MGILEGEESEQGIKNLFEEIMTENFPHLVEEIDIQVQEAETHKQNESKKAHIIIKMSKVKDKDRIKTSREKQLVTYKETPIRLSADFSREFASQKGLARNIQSDERKARTHNQDYSLQELSFRIKG